MVVFRFFQARPQASTRSGKKNSFNRDSREEDKERKRKEERGGGGGAGEERKNTNIDRLARLDGAHTYTRRFFPPLPPFIEAREASFSGVDSRIMFAERALSKRMPRLGWTVCWRSARCLFYLAAICIQGGGRRGRRGNIALQCIKQFFSLSLSLFPNRRPFPDSSSSIRSEISLPR